VFIGLVGVGTEEEVLSVLVDGVVQVAVTRQVLRAVARRGFRRVACALDPDRGTWRREALVSAAESGNLQFLQWVLVGEGAGSDVVPADASLTEGAAKAGSTEALCWLAEHGCPLDQFVGYEAARLGHVHVLEWLVDHGVTVGDGEMEMAAGGGQVTVLNWLEGRGIVATEECMRRAAVSGSIAAVQWLLEHNAPFSEETVALDAAADPSGELLRWWVQQGRRWSPVDVARRACTRGSLAAARIVFDLSGELHETVADRAMRLGELDMVRFAVEQNVPVTFEGGRWAVRTGNFATLGYAFQNGLYTMDDNLLEFIKTRGTDEAVQFARDMGYILSEVK
jgi:hypothetical protein